MFKQPKEQSNSLFLWRVANYGDANDTFYSILCLEDAEDDVVLHEH